VGKAGVKSLENVVKGLTALTKGSDHVWEDDGVRPCYGGQLVLPSVRTVRIVAP
jgi:hypothetical protein